MSVEATLTLQATPILHVTMLSPIAPLLAMLLPQPTPRTTELIGFAAAFCTTTAFIPQLVRVLRLRSARDISLPTFLLFSVGVFLWLLYGIFDRSTPVIASNSVTLVLSLSILFFKIRYDYKASRQPQPTPGAPGHASQRSSQP